MGFPGAQMVKNLPAMQGSVLGGASQVALVIICLPLQETQETWVQSQDQEDPLGEKTSTPLQYSRLKNSMDKRSLAG